MTREEFWMQIYLKDLGSNKESFHANKALAEFDDRFPVQRESSNEDSSEWIDWEGGECPVPRLQAVQVWLRGSKIAPECDVCIERAYGWDWDHTGLDGDIIKYRVIKYRVVKD